MAPLKRHRSNHKKLRKHSTEVAERKKPSKIIKKIIKNDQTTPPSTEAEELYIQGHGEIITNILKKIIKKIIKTIEKIIKKLVKKKMSETIIKDITKILLKTL